MIDVSHLSYVIADHQILNDITTQLPRNQITALIGPNGAGKSTLLGAIARQLTPSVGEVRIGGENLTQIDPQVLAKRMAIVAQQLHVGSRIRVADLVGFGRWPHSQGRLSAADNAAISDALKRFDLTALHHRFLDELSGGQRQRAFLAMAYTQDTDWLLLDEPLNNLDLKHARSLMAHLRQMVDHGGKSVVVVLHDLNFTLAWADHVVAMRAGQVVFSGPTTEVATSIALSDLYQTEIEVTSLNDRRFALYHR
ncbi:ABC transporter ATP-binding protein [Thalassobius sp. Cn5-15]|uniref:iron ABC transporter ATP-binding protein n=1 Tax=Thalassobius sp. Cn5-15 TaxID=2917763 RepID=UPI001EF24F29|nr:ATP-binding cassette domain-containing protein [Thalassobius sp. Cn5-15]MCG7494229.1 ATP-binding cassette domain-containing protein [Thalassobius sp. Cn5-15]